METKNMSKIHTLTIYNREKLELTSAVEVISSTDREVIARLEDSFIYIAGTNLTISKLVPEEELLVVSGNILGLKYEGKALKKSFWSRVFKWTFLTITIFICF